MKKLCAAVLLCALVFGAACASAPVDDPGPMTAPQAAAPDPRQDDRMAELQTQLTELLERIDVLNQRIAHLEESNAALLIGRPDGRPVPVEGRQAPAEERRTEARAPEARAPETRAPENRPLVSEPPQQAVIGAQIAESYRQAITLFGRGKHAEARRGFSAVFEADPSGDLADNALFWIGETYFAAKDYTNAVRYYQRVVSDYPSENKAPDALFKIAMAQERTGDLALARRTLQQVIDRFPYSSTASSAKAELQRIRF